jgi:hypothetical protein
MEKISDFGGLDPLVSKTKNYYYYFAARIIPRKGYHLWFSRKPAQGGSWEDLGELTKTYAMSYGRYNAVGEDDTAHICWMDRQHNMRRFNIDGPNIENDDIVYCHRKDSDSGFSKDVTLSKGVLYCYAPSISVEGNNVVIAWSGISSAGKHHTDYDPNDIYYVTSKDGGNTWSTPLKVTDKAMAAWSHPMPRHKQPIFTAVNDLISICGNIISALDITIQPSVGHGSVLNGG